MNSPNPTNQASHKMPTDLADTHDQAQFTILINNGADHQVAHLHALDFAMAAAAFGHDVKLIFQGDGLMLLVDHTAHQVDNQGPTQAAPLNDRFSRALTQLELFDLAPIYLCEKSLKRSALSGYDFGPLPTKVINSTDLAAAIQSPRHCLIF